MEAQEVLDFGQEAIWVLIQASLPIMLVALLVGLIISLFQALTQIQEMTLSFVPKIMAIFVSLLFFMPYIGHRFEGLMASVIERISGF